MNQRHEQHIEYSEALKLEKTQSDKNFEIWNTSSGEVFVDGESKNSEESEDSMVQAFIREPSSRIHIIADKNTPYRYVDGVVQILQMLQHRVVSFVVKEPEA